LSDFAQQESKSILKNTFWVDPAKQKPNTLAPELVQSMTSCNNQFLDKVLSVLEKNE
tara:strand:- start:9 stop:179 length:171 start_codon:yes stop_codon:yes gene_type:complete